MSEPRGQAKRWHISLLGMDPVANKTMNQVLTEIFVDDTGIISIGLGPYSSG